MASISKRGNSWRVQIYKFGKRKTKTFKTKAEARLWANQTELELEDEANNGYSYEPLQVIIERYRTEVTSKKRSYYSEHSLLNIISKEEFSKKPICKVNHHDIVRWREELSLKYKSNTILRRISMLSHIFKVAVEWGLVPSNPCDKVSRPKVGKSRNRRISDSEIQDIVTALGYEPQDIARSSRQFVALSFLFALQTGMRLGEILSLTWENIDIPKQVATLPITKNGDSREVPLSSEAIRILSLTRSDNDFLEEKERVFKVGYSNFEDRFREVVKILGIKNLRFHDTRHEAITRLAKKLNVLELARMVGHRNIKSLMIYYNESAEDIAKKLD